MDNVSKLIILSLISFNANAGGLAQLLSSKVGFNVARGPTSTTYTAGGSTFTGTGIKTLDSQFSALPVGYVTRPSIPAGNGVTIDALKVTAPVSAVSIALSVASLIPKPAYAALIVAGGALYSYLHDNGINKQLDGSFSYSPVDPNFSDSNSYNPQVLYNARGAGYPLNDACMIMADYFLRPRSSVTSSSGTCFTSGSPFYYPSIFSASSCNSGDIFSGGKCNAAVYCSSGQLRNQTTGYCVTPVSTPINSSFDVLPKLTTPPSDPAGVLQDIYKADPTGASMPASDGPPTVAFDMNGPLLDSPSRDFPKAVNTNPVQTISLPKSTTVSPDGSVQTNSPFVGIEQTSPSSFAVSDNNKVTTTSPAGAVSNADTQNSMPVPVSTTSTTTTTTPAPEQKTDCDKLPNSIGCSEYGAIPTPDIIETVNVPFSMTPTSLGSGSCPAPISIDLSSRHMTISYQPVCTFAGLMSPIVIAMAWFSAAMLILSPIKGS